MDSTQVVVSATSRALAIPEVLALIITNSDLARADLANLRQVCRSMSNCEVIKPFLWENATAEGLLQLIKSTDICRWPGAQVRTIRLGAHTRGVDSFEDFHHNAQYVRILEIYDRDFRPCYTMDGWDTLWTERRVLGRPLLPNLRALRFLNTSQLHGADEYKWLQTLAHPGLEELSLIPDPLLPAGRIPFSILPFILNTLIKTCPRIQVLELATNNADWSPRNLDHDIFDSILFSTALRYRNPGFQLWHKALPALSRLRHLTVSYGWFDPVGVHALGSLPRLESLTVFRGSLDGLVHESQIDSTPLENAFPMLTKLSVCGLEVSKLCSVLAVENLLSRLTTINLNFHFVVDEDRADEFERIFCEFRSAPRLQNLRLDYVFRLDSKECPAEVFNTMEGMSLHSSLENVYLGNIRINKQWRYRSPECIRSLGLIWPNVRTLSMTHQSASIRDLENFATLPGLTHLTLNLDLKHPYIPAKPKFKRASLKVLTSSGPVRLSTDYDDILLCATALLRLWPSLTCVTWSDDDPMRTELAGLFGSKILACVKQYMFGKCRVSPKSPRNRPKLSAAKKLKELEVCFEQIIEDLEETDGWNSDSDWNSD